MSQSGSAAPNDFAFPIIHWGDVGATVIFVVEMFALYRWPARSPIIAWLTLLAVVVYVLVRLAIRTWST